MPYSKKFTNIKMGGVAGPQNLGASQVVLSSAIPCRGARIVLFHLFSTDSNTPAAAAYLATNDPAGAPAAGFGLVSNSTLIRMNGVGGLTVAVAPNANAANRMQHGFVQLNFTAHASGHTAFQVDAEVLYDGDAEAWRSDMNQYLTVPV